MAITIIPPKSTTSGVHSVAAPKAKESTGASEFTQQVQQQKQTQNTASAQSSGGIGKVDIDGIFQALIDPNEANQRGIHFGNDLLDQLDQLRLQISLGAIDIYHLEKIQKLAERELQIPTDSKLGGILREIQTLAAVQLAKIKG